ncbi:cbb3-type cytochrome c oxidase subunit I [Bradyrhizobium sp. CCBAU 11386]|uniref:cbb3-type cytochrome c oxidase subunit I n=1 Tax=Bradyrhizobium sp. CCBAU 11386 TaxID=1630837 RepID=UPI003FA4BFCF
MGHDPAFTFCALLAFAASLAAARRSTVGRTTTRSDQTHLGWTCGIAGFSIGLVIASQLAWPALNFGLSWTSFGRLRPLHTSALIFAFGGKVLIATSFSWRRPAARDWLAILRRGSWWSAMVCVSIYLF